MCSVYIHISYAMRFLTSSNLQLTGEESASPQC
jgi:hypothetical protein